MSVAIPTPRWKPLESERRNFGLRPELSLVEWTERHIRIVDGPLVEGGPPVEWSPETFPLQRAPMESLTDPRWSKTVLCTAPQAFGKTVSVAIPPLLYAIEYLHVTPFYCAATKELAAAQWAKKVEPAIKADGELVELLHANPDFGGTKHLRHFTNGTSLHLVGSESVGQISGHTSPVIICDDVQAYPASLPRFGHPADYVLTRSGAMPSSQCIHVQIGTAGTVDDYLWQAMLGSAYYVPAVPCPGCGVYQLLDFNRLVFDVEDPQAALGDTRLACVDPECEQPIRFEDLPAMLAEHLWVSVPPDQDWVKNPPAGGVRVDLDNVQVYPDTDRNTAVAGFWANALYWPLGKTWGEHAADWIGRRGNPDREKDFNQNIRVIPFEEPEIDEQRLTIEEVEKHARGGYTAGTVPAGADVVTVTVDVQSGYVYYLVRAWQTETGTSWLVELGTRGKPLRGPSEETIKKRRTLALTRALDEVDAMGRKGWDVVDQEGEVVGHIDMTLGLIDRGFEPDIVGSWWVAHSEKWRQILGQRAGRPAALWPIKPQQDKRARYYRVVGVNQAKHIVRRLQRIEPDEPGYQHLPTSGIHANTMRAYCRHMASERFNRQRPVPRWEKITEGMANHWWDCEVYQVCAAVACRIKLPTLEAPQVATRKSAAPAGRSRGGWKIGR